MNDRAKVITRYEIMFNAKTPHESESGRYVKYTDHRDYLCDSMVEAVRLVTEDYEKQLAALRAALTEREERIAAQAKEIEALRADARNLIEGCERFRDNVLHQRGLFEGGTLDNDQTNAVLDGFDEETAVAHELLAAAAGRLPNGEWKP